MNIINTIVALYRRIVNKDYYFCWKYIKSALNRYAYTGSQN